MCVYVYVLSYKYLSGGAKKSINIENAIINNVAAHTSGTLGKSVHVFMHVI